MSDPAIYSDLSAVIIVLGGVMLALGIRWLLYKSTEKKFFAPMIIFAIVEMAVGGILIALG